MLSISITVLQSVLFAPLLSWRTRRIVEQSARHRKKSEKKQAISRSLRNRCHFNDQTRSEPIASARLMPYETPYGHRHLTFPVLQTLDRKS